MRRRIRSAAILTIFLVLAAGRLAAAPQAKPSQEWPPVTEFEMALKDCPQQPGAPAVYLYREVKRNDNDYTSSEYCRIKILTAAGKERANIEIPYTKGSSKITDLKARVIHPDGAVVPFNGQVFDKTALRVRGLKVTVKTFALPNVDAGCIIDYRYTIVPDSGGSSSEKGLEVIENLLGAPDKPREGGIDMEGDVFFLPIETWEIQEDLFTYKAKFSYAPSDFLEEILNVVFRGLRLNWVSHGIKGAKPVRKEGYWELQVENIPAFEAEEYMVPESTQRMDVRFFYLNPKIETPDIYWEEESGNWQKGAEKFMGKAGTAPAEAQKLTAGLTDPQAKLKALYGRAQEIRNLSYDRTLTKQRRKELKIKDNRNVADVLKNNYGLRSDITRAFAAMAVAAGFDAKVVRVATRDDNLFDKVSCNLYSQFDTELAVVNLNGKDQYYDPATPLCPIGLVQWSCTGAVGLAPSKNPPAFMMTPTYPPDTALTQREFALRLDAEGNLAGTVKVTYLGQEALVRRLEHVSDDAVEIRKDLEGEMVELLPVGAKAILQSVENMTNSADRIVATFDLTVPGIATLAGQRTLVPVCPLLGSGRQPFRHAQRKYPVCFPYPRREFDDIVITLPEGVKVETVPAARASRDESFNYSLICAAEDGTRIHAQRDFIIKKFLFPVVEYGAVKAFFDKARAGDEEQVVLTTEKK